MELELQNKVFVDVGAANGGIGSLTARRLLQEGALVFGVDRAQAALEATFGRLSEEFGVNNVGHLTIDLTEKDAPQRIMDAAFERFGRVHGLINCVGINDPTSLRKMTLEGLERTLRVNFSAPVMLAREFYLRAIAFGGADHPEFPDWNIKDVVIAHVTSVMATEVDFGSPTYCASKAALDSFGKYVMVESRKYGIRSITIRPGFVDTGLVRDLPSSKRDEIIARTPAGRFADPDEIARFIAFAVSPMGSYLWGPLDITGGYKP